MLEKHNNAKRQCACRLEKKVLWLKDRFIIVLIFKNLPHA